jgi:hypothetical protein
VEIAEIFEIQNVWRSHMPKIIDFFFSLLLATFAVANDLPQTWRDMATMTMTERAGVARKAEAASAQE